VDGKGRRQALPQALGFQGATAARCESRARTALPDNPVGYRCQRGNRTVDRLELATKRKTQLADSYNGKS